MYSRRFWKYASVLALIAVLEIALSSPLFATLGFEYSTLMALVLSLVCGLYIIPLSSERGGGWGEEFLNAALLSLIPLVISILSLAIVPNCSLLDGLIFYFEIAIPSALLGAGFGLAFSRMTKSVRLARWLFIAFWVVSFIISLLPGYSNPQLFTYGWQYGFFPGLTWDESIELTNAYLIFRVENVVLLLLLLPVIDVWYRRRSQVTRILLSGLFGGVIVFVNHFNDSVGITTSHDEVARKLNEHITVGDATIRYAIGSLTSDEAQKVEGDVKWYLYDIRDKYRLQAHEPITIYIYPSTEDLFQLIGTRTASISKPWLSELHIAKENLHSLKHELAHVLLREMGSWPFYASWSTGLTEGAAMAVEYEYDGIYTLDEHAANILRLGYANGVSSVMAFTGFAANASQKSYVLAGSFSRFLVATYGAERFTRIYSSLSFQKEYGKPLDTLEAEWKRWLAPLEQLLTYEDSLHFRYYYDRVSIIFNPCLRRIGKLERKAEIAYREKRYADAEALYRDAVQEGGGLSPLIMESYVMIHRNDLHGALALFDTSHFPSVRKQYPALYSEKADLCVMLGDTARAAALYDSAKRIKLSAASFLGAWLSSMLLQSLDSTQKAEFGRYLYYSYNRSDSMRTLILDSMRLGGQKRAPLAELALDELTYRILLKKGRVHEAQMYASLSELNSVSPETALAIQIMQCERMQYGQISPVSQPLGSSKADKEIWAEFERRRKEGY